MISSCPLDGFTPYLFNILDLLAHLLYQHFKFDRNVGRAECGRFEPSVLASRLSSCIRKSSRRPQGPWSQCGFNSIQVSLEAIHLFLDIRALQNINNFLFKPDGIGLDINGFSRPAASGEARFEARAVACGGPAGGAA